MTGARHPHRQHQCLRLFVHFFPRMLAAGLFIEPHLRIHSSAQQKADRAVHDPDGPWAGQQEAGPEPGWQQKQSSSVVQRRTPARRHWTVQGPKTGMHDNIIAPRLIRGRAIMSRYQPIARCPQPCPEPTAGNHDLFRATLVGALVPCRHQQYILSPVPGLVPVPVAGRRMLGHPNKA